MQSNAEDTCRVVEIELDVKSWTNTLPDVRTARPGTCPGCNAPGIEPGGRVVLHGHGLRIRSWWGPPDPDGKPELGEMIQRRYACQRCKAIIVVRPPGMLARRRYAAAGMVLALWLWAGALLTDAEVRAKISVHRKLGDSRPERWTTLRRWARAARDGVLWRSVRGDRRWTLRACAERAARVVGALADLEITDPRLRAFAGAAHAR
jgi:hypothetical protein